MNFEDLQLAPAIVSAVRDLGYETPTPIQAQAIPHLLKGRDLLGIAQTGTGKTAAFALPMIQRLITDRRRPGPHATRSLVLAPTRELASQIAESFRTYAAGLDLRVEVVFGGVSIGKQERALMRGVDVLAKLDVTDPYMRKGKGRGNKGKGHQARSKRAAPRRVTPAITAPRGSAGTCFYFCYYLGFACVCDRDDPCPYPSNHPLPSPWASPGGPGPRDDSCAPCL